MDDWRDHGELIIGYGIYANKKKLEEVWEMDPDYCISTLRDIPKYQKYIDMRYMEEVRSSPEKMEEFKLEKDCVTRLLKILKPYHYIRLEDCLGESMIIQKKQVHESSSYTPYVEKYRYYCNMGIFYDYLIRKHVYNLKGLEAFDHRAEVMLASEDPICLQFEKDYQIFKDRKYGVLDILPQIYHVSLLHTLYFNEHIDRFSWHMLRLDHIETVIKYVSSIPNVLEASLNPVLGIEYFSADADMVIGDTIIDFKVSKYEDIKKEVFWKVIFYAVSYWVREKKRMTKFVIYNVLLGIEHSLELKNINYDKLVSFFDEIIIRDENI